jgi:hypothetical protein
VVSFSTHKQGSERGPTDLGKGKHLLVIKTLLAVRWLCAAHFFRIREHKIDKTGGDQLFILLRRAANLEGYMDNERQEVAVMGFRLPGSTSQKMVTISEEQPGGGGVSQGETRPMLS